MKNASRRPSGASERYVSTQNPPKLWPSTLQRSTLELAADPLGVADDRVGAEVLQVLGLLLRRHARQRADRRRAAGAALVEHEDAELAAAPGRARTGRRVARRAGRLEARPALEEHEERPVAAVGVGHLAREHGDTLAVGPAWSSGTENSCSVRTRPGVRMMSGIPRDYAPGPAGAVRGFGEGWQARSSCDGVCQSAERARSTPTGPSHAAFT